VENLFPKEKEGKKKKAGTGLRGREKKSNLKKGKLYPYRKKGIRHKAGGETRRKTPKQKKKKSAHIPNLVEREKKKENISLNKIRKEKKGSLPEKKKKARLFLQKKGGGGEGGVEAEIWPRAKPGTLREIFQKDAALPAQRKGGGEEWTTRAR